MKRTTSERTAEQAYYEHLTSVMANLEIIKAELLLKRNQTEMTKTETGRGFDWADVGDITDYDEKLQDIVDSLLNQGEYAEEE